MVRKTTLLNNKCTTRALIGQFPCLDQSIQTRKFPAQIFFLKTTVVIL